MRRVKWYVSGLVVIGMALVLGTGCSADEGTSASGGASLVADEPYYESAESLEGAADIIVRGRVMEINDAAPGGIPQKAAEVSVLSVGKGNPESNIKVLFIDSNDSPIGTEFEIGESYTFLLHPGDGGYYFLVNSTQGSYPVKGNALVPRSKNDVTLSNDLLAALGLDS